MSDNKSKRQKLVHRIIMLHRVEDMSHGKKNAKNRETTPRGKTAGAKRQTQTHVDDKTIYTYCFLSQTGHFRIAPRMIQYR